jgi:hypothetical protein
VNWLNNILGTALLLSGLFIIAASYIRQFTNFKNRHKENASWSSSAPFVGPAFVITGFFILPLVPTNWIFIVIILDPDTVISIVSLPWLIKGLRS